MDNGATGKGVVAGVTRSARRGYIAGIIVGTPIVAIAVWSILARAAAAEASGDAAQATLTRTIVVASACLVLALVVAGVLLIWKRASHVSNALLDLKVRLPDATLVVVSNVQVDPTNGSNPRWSEAQRRARVISVERGRLSILTGGSAPEELAGFEFEDISASIGNREMYGTEFTELKISASLGNERVAVRAIPANLRRLSHPSFESMEELVVAIDAAAPKRLK